MRTVSTIALAALLWVGPLEARAAEPFSQSPCWDAKCPDEVAACEAHNICALIAECIQEGEAVITCFNEYESETGADLYKAIQECGWEACAHRGLLRRGLLLLRSRGVQLRSSLRDLWRLL